MAESDSLTSKDNAMAAERPKWQLCEWCREIKERPCISEKEAHPCEFGKRARIRRAEQNARNLERIFRDLENW